MQAQSVNKRDRLKQLGAFLLFAFVAGTAAMPTLSVQGAIAGRYKMILLLLVSCRLAWCIFRRTFRYRDYLIYFAVVVGFCILMDFQY
jgi:hypothetical protein